MSDDDTGLAAIIAEIPLYRPAHDPRRGRVSATTRTPGQPLPSKVVVDFGSTPEGPDLGPDLEIATRAWEHPHPPGQREIRGLCGERDLMQRRTRDPLSAESLGLPDDAAWSRTDIDVDGVTHAFTVLRTSHSWVAAALVGGFLVRVFARAPGPQAIALRRIASPEELERLRGRG